MVCEGESVKFGFIAEMGEENERRPREERFPVISIHVRDKCRRYHGRAITRGRSPRRQHAEEDVTLTTLIVAIHQANRPVWYSTRAFTRTWPGRVPGEPEAGPPPGPGSWPRPACTRDVQGHHSAQDKANACGLADLVGREFVPAGKNQLWYRRITYIFTMSGWANS